MEPTENFAPPEWTRWHDARVFRSRPAWHVHSGYNQTHYGNVKSPYASLDSYLCPIGGLQAREVFAPSCEQGEAQPRYCEDKAGSGAGQGMNNRPIMSDTPNTRGYKRALSMVVPSRSRLSAYKGPGACSPECLSVELSEVPFA